jgi:hypothetical protein
MQIEPFGIVVIFAGILALVLDYRWSILFAFAFTVLGAAEAIGLSALGGATITPPHLFLGFVILKVLLQHHGLSSAAANLAPNKPGGWLAFVVCYGIFVSVVAPGLFPDTLIYAFSRLESGVGVRLEPLTLGNGQITQDVYAIGSVLLFATAIVLLRKPGASRHVLHGLMICSALNLLFAVLDVGSYYAGNADLLAFVRTGAYGQLYTNSEGGLKRIVGSFPEASTFSVYSCILLGFWGSLWMQRYRPRLSGVFAFCTLTALLLSTSSTAYVAVFVLLTLFIGGELLAALSIKQPRRISFIAVAVPMLIFLALVAVLVRPEFVDAVTNMLDETVFNKPNTASGIERFTWNSQAWQNIFDTYGVGIGIGGGRASSYPLILLSNVGLLGTIAYTVFAGKIIIPLNFSPATGSDRAIGIACRWAFAAALISSTISAGVFELGVLPYLAAAAAAAIGFKDARVNKRSKLALATGRPFNESAQ